MLPALWGWQHFYFGFPSPSGVRMVALTVTRIVMHRASFDWPNAPNDRIPNIRKKMLGNTNRAMTAHRQLNALG